MSEVVVFTTGGTIASQHDDAAGGLVSQGSTVHEWLVGEVESRVVELAALSSTSITPAMLSTWARQVQTELDNPEVVGGVVATGTNTMAEVAFFLELAVSTSKNLVVTGAMNSPGSEAFDGGQNLQRAIMLAQTAGAEGLGTVVFMNDHVHGAQFVEKTDANGIHAFESPQTGPVGRFIPDSVGGRFRFFATPRRWSSYYANAPSVDVTAIYDPRIVVLKAYLGADSSLILAALDHGVDGLVIEGFPSGELPPGMASGVRRALDKGIPVAVTCDAQRGEPTDIYAGLGEGAWLRSNGVIFAGGLTAGKAHMCMYVSLQQGLDIRQTMTQVSER